MSTNVIENTDNDLQCPIRYVLDVAGGKWKLPILCMLAGEQPARYSTIKRKLTGVTNTMLAQSLKELEAGGMVHREQYNEVPPRVEYTLTEKGISFIPVLVQAGSWAAEQMQKDSMRGAFCEMCQSIK